MGVRAVGQFCSLFCVQLLLEEHGQPWDPQSKDTDKLEMVHRRAVSPSEGLRNSYSDGALCLASQRKSSLLYTRACVSTCLIKKSS